MAKKASVRDVRRRNRALILRHVWLNGPTSRSEVGAATGLSAATVTNVMNELLAEGTVREEGFLDSDGGRRRAIVSVAHDAALVIGADVGETQIGVDVLDLGLNRLAGRVYPFKGRRIEVGEARTAIADQVTSMLAELGVDAARVVGLGLGVPGIVEEDRQVVHAEVVGWHGVDFSGFGDHLGIPAYIDNGAKSTTQAEAWFGAARDTDHAVMVLIGEGAGAGIITDGRLYRGSSSSAGEWGHTKISLDGPHCRCGRAGCVETFVGASAVLSQWRGPDETWLGRETEGVDAVLTAWRDGDPAAQRAIDGLVRHLGLALSNLVNLYNPEKIIVGGWFGDRIAAELLGDLQAAVRAFALDQPGGEVVLVRSQLGPEAAVLGAATLPISQLIESGAGVERLTTA
ncbi:ROK family protein [Dactylosporangium sucinum]|uniref:Sugar kinase n=1 Tax=Dactylosporangium sucinum TaxID=1424081 RepID=A0A917U0X0_9ACTN|nr:ROK family protein [Dactylosporangium sucinum]GGM44948.1 sugar kinase [Dactylosporangium sucinum]